MLARSCLLLLALAASALGCDQLIAIAQATEPPATHEAPAPKPEPEKADKAKATQAEPRAEGPDDGRYGMPFAWEVSKKEPLARTRAFMIEALGDNAAHVAEGKSHFVPFLEKQHPRVTVVTCSDSRVQADAWDKTPADDDFTVRNIGNQVTLAHGSVEYGVDELHTPLLLIVGHTGCGAVKAVLDKTADLPAAIQHELAGIVLEKHADHASEKDVWTRGVIENVNAQVAFSVKHFAPQLRRGDLTVVGAVYDFRNDMGKGHGRLNVVNVNGNTEPERITAFTRALLGTGEPVSGGAPELPELSAAFKDSVPTKPLNADLARAAAHKAH